MFNVIIWYRPWKSDGHIETKEFENWTDALTQAQTWKEYYSSDYIISIEIDTLWQEKGTGTASHRDV